MGAGEDRERRHAADRSLAVMFVTGVLASYVVFGVAVYALTGALEAVLARIGL